MKRIVLCVVAWLGAASAFGAEPVYKINSDLAAVPVNIAPLVLDSDLSLADSLAYDDVTLVWNFTDVDGNTTQTAVTPTETDGDYDWVNLGNAMYAIEIPASEGASINNDAAGFGWFTGTASGVVPWRGPVIQFSEANVVDGTVTGADLLSVRDVRHGYNNVLHAGPSGQPYSTLAAAFAAASSGDLIVAHGPWMNTEVGLGKAGVTLYLDRGVALQGTAGTDPVFALEVTEIVIRGEGTINLAACPLVKFGDEATFPQGAECTVDIEVDRFLVYPTSSDPTVGAGDGGQATIVISWLRVVSRDTQFGSHIVPGGAAQTKFADYRSAVLDLGVVVDSGGGALCMLDGPGGNTRTSLRVDSYRSIGSADIFTGAGSGGTMRLNGVFRFTHASTNGLKVDGSSGFRVFCESGGVSISTPGRPSISGNATFNITEGFAYDTTTATATNIIQTRGAAILADTADMQPRVSTALTGVTAPGTAGGLLTLGTGAGQLNPSGGEVGLVANAIGTSELANDAITAAKLAANAIGASELATDAGTELGAATWAAATRTLTNATNIFSDGQPLNRAQLVDDIWNEPRGEGAAPGTMRYYLDSSVSAVSTGGYTLEEIADAVLAGLADASLTTSELAVATRQEIDANSTLPSAIEGLLATSSTFWAGGVTVDTGEETPAEGSLGSFGGSGGALPDDFEQAVADAMKKAPTAGAAESGSVLARVAELETSSASIETTVAQLEAGQMVMPVNQVPVPRSRTWTLIPTDAGLVGQFPISIQQSAFGKLFAVDFRLDLATNGRIVDFESITIIKGDEAGLVFGEDLENSSDYGVDGTQSKVRITPVQAGEYTLRVVAQPDDSDGGGMLSGDVVLIVTP